MENRKEGLYMTLLNDTLMEMLKRIQEDLPIGRVVFPQPVYAMASSCGSCGGTCSGDCVGLCTACCQNAWEC